MKTNMLTAAFLATSLLAVPMLSMADDAFNKKDDAIENRYEKAKDSCEKFKGDAQDTCEAKAKATYEQEQLTLKKAKQDHEEPANPQPAH